MGKYQPLADFLKDRTSDDWEASFADVERVLNFPLPPSAKKHHSWWGNASQGNHSQAKGWIDAGWVTVPKAVNLREGRVRFVKTRKPERRSMSATLDQLRKDAMQISGIRDLEILELSALTMLIQREAALGLARLGGTMPDAWVPARERPEP